MYFIWAIGGIAVGATGALLWVKGLTSDWVEATGTWFGAIATVLALLWAVQTFRADQDRRDNERKVAETSRAEESARGEAAILADAASVSLGLRGAGGHGPDGEKLMTSMFVDVHNHTDQHVTVTGVTLDEGLTMRGSMPLPIRIKPRESWTQKLDIEPTSAADEELGGRPLGTYGGVVIFNLHSREWCASTAGEVYETSGHN